MYLTELHIENFRLLKNVDIKIDQSLTLFVGKNNTGKTSIMQLIKLVLLGNKSLPFDDYPLECRNQLYKLLFQLQNNEIAEKDFLNAIPKTSIRFIIDYSDVEADEPLGSLGQFVIDMDETLTKAIVEAKYEPTTAINCYKVILERYETICNVNENINSEDAIAKAVKESFASLFHLRIVAVNPTDNEDYQERSIKDFQEIFVFKEIAAERSLDEAEYQNDKPLSRIMNQLFNPDLEILEEELQEDIGKLSKLIDDFNTNAQSKIDELMGNIVKSMIQFGYPSAEDLELHAVTNISLKNQIINNTDLTYTNRGRRESLPSTHNGLGYKNLIKISLLLQEFARNVKHNLASIPVLYIEEPEAHMHPQLQTMFVNYVTSYLGEAVKEKKAQILLTTHSAHVANTIPFNQVRYMRRFSDSVCCKNMIEFYEKAVNDEYRKKNLEFLQKYMKLSYCDLYFCDKAILVEGAAERLLIPDMIEKCDSEGCFKNQPTLKSQYYTLLEVGGAYAHNFFEFVDFLEIPTLIITDVDYVDANNKRCELDVATRSSNGTIIRWCHDVYGIAVSNSIAIGKILELQEDDIKKSNGLRHIEFQIQENGAAPRSFEEAIINVNREKFDISEDVTLIEYNEDKIGKTDFALRLLVDARYSDYSVPAYIKNGLIWLDKQSKIPDAVPVVTKLKRTRKDK